VSKKEEKTEPNRRRGLARRLYSYAQHIPERRNGGERRDKDDNAQDQNDKCVPDYLHEEIADQDSPTTTQHSIKKDTP
jgi:hypothetical protein